MPQKTKRISSYQKVVAERDALFDEMIVLHEAPDSPEALAIRLKWMKFIDMQKVIWHGEFVKKPLKYRVLSNEIKLT